MAKYGHVQAINGTYIEAFEYIWILQVLITKYLQKSVMFIPPSPPKKKIKSNPGVATDKNIVVIDILFFYD